MENDSGEDASQKTRRRPGRAPTSCAECRRLKFRCDRNVPCAKCVSRGCSSICPDGTLLPWKQNRLALAKTDELQEQNEQLRARIYDLEHALRSMQASVSIEPHPLLQTSPQIPQHGMPHDAAQASNQSEQELDLECCPMTAKDESFVDAFGTLSLGPCGESSFLGRTARSEYLMSARTWHRRRKDVAPTRSFKQVAQPVFLGLDVPDEGLAHEIFSMLPQLPEALRLCEIYQRHGKYLYAPIAQQELDEVLEHSYERSIEEAFPGQRYHAMALLFSIFAIGAFLDTDGQSYSTEAEGYYYVACSALSLDLRTTQLSIETYLHIAKYLYFSDTESTNLDLAWMYVGHAVRLGQSIGLQLDGTHWNLSQEDIQRRRRLFWQLFVFDVCMSFVSGRPPITSVAHIDCAYPQDGEETDGGKHISFHSWARQYAVLAHTIMETAFGARSPPYSVIISLDRRVRNFPVPDHWRPPCDTPDPPPVPPEIYMQRWLILSRKEIILMHLHRSYFAQALQEMPTDLAKHRYLPSVIAIFRSAWRLIRGLQACWESAPQGLVGTNGSWSHGLSAAIVMCLIVTRTPTSSMAPSALAELDALLKLFQDVAPASRMVFSLLDSISKLQRKAHESFTQASFQGTTTLSPLELDRLGGKTHLLVDTNSPESRPSYPGESTHKQAAGDAEGGFTDDIHPTIVQDMTYFDTATSGYNHFFFDNPTISPVSHTTTTPTDFDTDLYPSNFHQPSTGQGGGHDQPQPAPGLETTWINFVEQLGFLP